jgi:hypothetical protein
MVRDPIAGQLYCIIDGLNYCSEDSLWRLMESIVNFYLDDPQTIVDDNTDADPPANPRHPYQPAKSSPLNVAYPGEVNNYGLKMILLSQLNLDRTLGHLAQFPYIDMGRGR